MVRVRHGHGRRHVRRRRPGLRRIGLVEGVGLGVGLGLRRPRRLGTGNLKERSAERRRSEEKKEEERSEEVKS